MENRPIWAINGPQGNALISKLSVEPETEALASASHKKAKKGEPYRFPFDVIIEATSQFGKLATVKSATPGSAHFQIGRAHV